MQAGGGGINDLARHAVAALLNASSLQSNVNTPAGVIAAVQAAVAAGPAAISALAALFESQQAPDNCTGFINS